jgi:Dipeptidyl aminopeptidases/acylaminoacyl-peptidases
MAPFIFDEGTPRERVAEDIAVRLRATVSNDGYFAQLAAVRAWEGTHDRLAGLTMPTLVIHGETDQLVPVENGRIIARAIPHARLVTIPHASHILSPTNWKPPARRFWSFSQRPSRLDVRLRINILEDAC